MKVMQFLYRFIGLSLAVIILLFAFSNREMAILSFWPLSSKIEMPVFMIGLGGLIIGFLLGVFVMGIRNVSRSWAKKNVGIKDGVFR